MERLGNRLVQGRLAPSDTHLDKAGRQGVALLDAYCRQCQEVCSLAANAMQTSLARELDVGPGLMYRLGSGGFPPLQKPLRAKCREFKCCSNGATQVNQAVARLARQSQAAHTFTTDGAARSKHGSALRASPCFVCLLWLPSVRSLRLRRF